MGDLVGHAIGPYRILAELGRGGMGVVYRAHDPRLGREVAIKLLAAEFSEDHDRLSRFEREARAASALNHPNILTVHEINTHDGKPYLVTELLEGRSLRKEITAGGLTVRKALEHGRQIASGLAAAHDRGICHRDLKPDNLFLNRDGRVTILDFGLAKLSEPQAGDDSETSITVSQTASGTVLGTPGYMAPEQVRGHATDHRTDIFALGIVLYEMITGLRPFRGESAADTIAAILREDPAPLSTMRTDVGPAVQRVIDRCLEKRPEDRFQSARDLAFALETAADTGVTTPAPEGARPSHDVVPQLQFVAEELDEPERPVFVARETEIERLSRLVEQAVAGTGTVVFVAGDAGTGKTALVNEAARRALETHPEIVVAIGSSSAQTGIGDAYAPWRQVLAQLTGDIGTRVLSRDQARRLREVAPSVTESVAESAQDLVGTLLAGASLVRRGEALAGDTAWLESLRELVERKAPLPPDGTLHQRAVFNQTTRVLVAAAKLRPLLLVVEDLHWADAGSLALFFHVGHEIAGHRLLVLGTYRPAEVALGRGGERHPLEPVVAELRRVHGEILLPLGQSSDRSFIDACVDNEPNRLGEEFRAALFHQTQGHALFTIELLRAMQDRGMLVREDEGGWVEGAELDWNALPARVEGVISERIDRLSEDLRDTLNIASVEGEDFTAEVLARVRETDTRATVRLLSRELEKRHRLVSARGVRVLAENRVSLYAFSHALFQRYVYNSLDSVERALHHEDVGTVLEALYGDRTGEIAPQLARHFREAGLVDKSIHYLHRAGESAFAAGAFPEAVAHLEAALELVATLEPGPDSDAKELDLLTLLGRTLPAVEGWVGKRAGEVWRRARELCESTGDLSRAFTALLHLASFHGYRGENPIAFELMSQGLDIVTRVGNPLLIAVMKNWQIFYGFPLGDFARVRDESAAVMACYDSCDPFPPEFQRPFDFRMLIRAWHAYGLWFLGYPEQARDWVAQTTRFADDHGSTELNRLIPSQIGAAVERLLRNLPATADYIQPSLKMLTESGNPEAFLGVLYLGWVQGCQGHHDEGIASIRRYLDETWAVGARIWRTKAYCMLAEVCLMAGRTQDGLDATRAGLEEAEETGERYHEAELRRLNGELLRRLADVDEREVEQCFQKAIEVARGQEAKGWELRAATSLARLWRDGSRRHDAHDLLGEVYGWFTEGFDTPDLLDARELLAELSSG